MKIKNILPVLFLFLSVGAYAQELGGVRGTVVSRSERTIITGARVTLSTSPVRRADTEKGLFEFRNVPAGTYTILIESQSYNPLQLTVTVGEEMRDLGRISLTSEYSGRPIDETEFTEFDMESGDVQSMPVILTASRDVFDNISGYKFSDMRFKARGYESGLTDVYLNGIYINDAMTGYSSWSLWTGLNDATRNQEVTSGASLTDYGVGHLGGSTNINARASQVRKGWRASVVNANNNYRFRLMMTYGSGELDNGWSYAFSASTRQGGNDWINGMYHNSWGYFGAVEKRFNRVNSIALTFLGTPQERAVQSASTQEAYDLVESNYYNPNWGYHGGSKKRDMRNARVRRSHEPVAVLNYNYEPSAKFSLTASAAFRFGKNAYSALDWYDAQDPRPDYYRNLPSYFADDPLKAGWVEEGWKTDWNIRQINWDRLYNINRNSYFDPDINYYGNRDVDGMRRSKYIIEDRRTDQRDFNAKVQIMSLVNDFSTLRVGADFRWNRTEYFKVVKDLLGGDYYLDVDQFAERDFGSGNAIQNNLHTPNRLVKEGDKFGYDYYGHLMTDRLWATYTANIGNWQLDAGFENGHTTFWRDGRWRKGLFPDNSEGKSAKQSFWTYKVKLGALYRIAGNQQVYANFSRIEDAPNFNKSFVSPRTRNTVVDNLKNEKITSVDVNYAIRIPTLRLRMSLFYTHIQDRTDLMSFYSDIDRAFTNFAMTGIDQKHMGIEVGLGVPIIGGLAFEGAFSYGYYIYSSNPFVTQTIDNSETVILDNERVYWKNYKVPSTPQTAINLGLRYRGRGNIYAGVDLNYFNAMYISMNPLYRTDAAHNGLTEDQSSELAHQERFPHGVTLNANFGKSWFIKGNVLGFSLEVKNIINDQQIRTGVTNNSGCAARPSQEPKRSNASLQSTFT